MDRDAICNITLIYWARRTVLDTQEHIRHSADQGTGAELRCGLLDPSLSRSRTPLAFWTPGSMAWATLAGSPPQEHPRDLSARPSFALCWNILLLLAFQGYIRGHPAVHWLRALVLRTEYLSFGLGSNSPSTTQQLSDLIKLLHFYNPQFSPLSNGDITVSVTH